MEKRGYLGILTAVLLLTGCTAGGGEAQEAPLAPAEEQRLNDTAYHKKLAVSIVTGYLRYESGG